jgi:hypothetical protein
MRLALFARLMASAGPASAVAWFYAPAETTAFILLHAPASKPVMKQMSPRA